MIKWNKYYSPDVGIEKQKLMKTGDGMIVLSGSGHHGTENR